MLQRLQIDRSARSGRAVRRARPGGAVVIDQIADPHAPGPSRLASAGQFPLTPYGQPQGGGKGTRLDLGRDPAGIAAVLSVPPADAPDGSIQALTAGQPFLLLVAAPGTDQVSYRVMRQHPAPDAVWTLVQLHDGWVARALPNDTTGAQVRVRWLRDGKVISQGATATPYAI